ncbi:MAG: hypothetical protein WC280_03700, partial [Patescibacteria group bacterium]
NDAVSGVSDPELKKIAFQKVLDKFLDNGLSVKSKKNSGNKYKKNVSKNKPSKKSPVKKKEKDPVLSELLQKINRTKYSEIHNLKKTLDKSLYILKICKDDLDVDGLIPSQISYLLGEVFRVKITKESISMALGAATKFVDRNECVVNGGKAFIYKIMHDGEEHVNRILNSAREDS